MGELVSLRRGGSGSIRSMGVLGQGSWSDSVKQKAVYFSSSPTHTAACKVSFLLDSRLAGRDATRTEHKTRKEWQPLEYAPALR